MKLPGERVSQIQNLQLRDEIDAGKAWKLRQISSTGGKGLGKKEIHQGNNSGYQAINFAYLEGAARIILLGYDMQKTGGKVHFFGDHPKPLGNGPDDFAELAKLFNPLAADLAAEGIEVINCTRTTALNAFPRHTLENVLSSLAQAQV